MKATTIFRSRHLLVLMAMLALIVSGPFLETVPHGLVILNTIGVLVLLAGSYAIADRKVLLVIGLLLSALSIAATAMLVVRPTLATAVCAHLCGVCLLTFFAITILIQAMSGGKVTADKIYAGICAYLLIGYGWAFAYAVLDELEPGAFATPQAVSEQSYLERAIEMRYFSFVTLATVGYGDIVPRSPGARTMAMLEAIFGQFYLVALIGRLIGMHIVYETSPRAGDA